MAQLLIDVVGYGSGPLTAAGSWEWSWELDRAGGISFPISAADPQAVHVDTDREVRAYLLRDGAPRLVVGSGIVEEIGDEVQTRGASRRSVDGSDLLIELGDRTAGNLLLSDGTGGPMAAASVPAALMAFAPAGWSVTGTLSSDVYLQCAGESVLAAWGKVLEQTGDHIMLAGPTTRQVVIVGASATASGVRAVQDGDSVALRKNPRVCLITKLKRTKDASTRYSRIYAYGGGNSTARLSLTGGTWTPPAGYTLDLTNNCIIHTATDTAKRRDHYESFKELTAEGTGTIAAVNALRKAAYEALRRHIDALRSYDLEVTKLDMPVTPGQTIRVVYYEFVDGRRTLAIDEDLYVLAVKQRIDKNGRQRTIGFSVASSDRWPLSDQEVQIGALSQARSMDAHEQPAVRATRADVATTAVTTTSVTDPNVAYINAGQTFSGANIFSGANRLSRAHQVVVIASYTVGSADAVLYANSASANVTITLPSASTNTGREVIIKRTGSASNTVTLQAPSGQTIDGGTKTLVVNESVTLHSNGTNWGIISRYLP